MELSLPIRVTVDASRAGERAEEALEAHDVILAALAGLAARRRSGEDLDRIDDALRAMSDATDASTSTSATRGLERAIADAAGNGPLASGLALLQRSAGEAARGTARRRRICSIEYAQLADAIEQRDPERASRSVSEIARCLRTAAPPAPRAPVNQPPASPRAAPRRGDRP